MRRFLVFIGSSGILSAMMVVTFVSTNSNFEQREVRKLITTRLEKFSDTQKLGAESRLPYVKNIWNSNNIHAHHSILKKKTDIVSAN